MELPSSTTIAFLIAAVCVYYVGLVVYRLYLSPMAPFPGPKLAAATLWYEFYYDVILHGKYTFKLQELHDRYGPIIRISPYELHINDPDFYDEIYVGEKVRRTEKYLWAVNMFGRSSSTFSTVDHDLHRLRRGALSPFFSKSSVQKLEPTVQGVVDKLVKRLQDMKDTGTTVNLIDAFAALTGDVIFQYAFAISYGFMDHPEFAPFWHQSIMDLSSNGYAIQHFTWLEPMLRNLPLWVTRLMNPGMMAMLNQQAYLTKQVDAMKADLAEGKPEKGQKTIFWDILTNDEVRFSEKETHHLVTEAQAVVGAGTVTTAHTLSILTFHLLDNPDILDRVRKEIKSVWPDSGSGPKWHQLEQLPYLGAVFMEGLRFSHGAPHRLQRIFPDTSLQYKDWIIPSGIPVGMTSILVHNHPAAFPDPQKFNPDRWLGPSAAQSRKYLVSFSKGVRSCLGMNLAYCEIYLSLAAILAPGRFSFELFETNRRDAEIVHDYFNPGFPEDSKGIRVTVN